MKDFSRTFKHPHNIFQTYSTAVFSMWHSFYGIKSLSNVDVYCTAHDSPIIAQNVDYWPVTTLDYKHFQGPLILNSKTFKHQIRSQGLSRALKSRKNFSRTFKEEWPPLFMAFHCRNIWRQHVLFMDWASFMAQYLSGQMQGAHPYCSA